MEEVFDIESFNSNLKSLHMDIVDSIGVLYSNGSIEADLGNETLIVYVSGQEKTLDILIDIYMDLIGSEVLEADNLIAFKYSIELLTDKTYDIEDLYRKIFKLSENDDPKAVENSDIELMTGIEFENLIEKLLNEMGMDVEKTKASGDGGIDLIAHNNDPFFKGKYIVQCKRWKSSIGEPILRDLYGVTLSEGANKGILITNSTFTVNAIRFAEGKPLELIDGDKLNSLLNKHNIKVISMDDSLEDEEDEENEEVKILRNQVRNDGNNLALRFKYTNMLFEYIGIYRKFTSHELLNKYVSEAIESLKIISDYRGGSSNPSIKFSKYFAYSQLGYLHNLKGEISEALKYYYKANEIEIKAEKSISDPKFHKIRTNYGGFPYGAIDQFYMGNILNILGNLDYLGLDDLKKYLSNKYSSRINYSFNLPNEMKLKPGKIITVLKALSLDDLDSTPISKLVVKDYGDIDYNIFIEAKSFEDDILNNSLFNMTEEEISKQRDVCKVLIY